MEIFDKITGIVLILFMSIYAVFTLIIDWRYVILLPPGFFGFYLIYKHSFEGRDHNITYKKYKEKISFDFNDKFRPLINENIRILGNKYHFYFLCFEDFISSLRYKFDSRITKILEKGWSKYKKSSKKVLLSYGEIYKDLYECAFNFLSSFLTTLLVIKKDYYAKIQEKLIKNEYFTATSLFEKEEINRIAEKIMRENIVINYEEDEIKYFSLEKYRINLSPNNIHKNKKETLYALRELNSVSQKDLNIEYITKILENIPLEDWNLMKIYKEFLLQTIKNTPDKYIYEYLQHNEFDLNEWIIPEYRHKIAHPGDFRPFKYKKNLYAMKVINRESNPKIIQIQDFCDAVLKILSIINYMYDCFFYNKFNIENSGMEEFKIDLRKIHKAFERSSLSIH